MQHSPYNIKYEQYFVMYSDRLKRRYYQGKPWAEAGSYTVWNLHYINKTYRIVIQ